MKKKILGIIAIISVGLLVACGKKEVKLDAINSSGSQSVKDMSGFIKDNTGNEWKETITGLDQNGNKVEFDINLRTEVTCDDFKIVNATAYDFTPENKEQFVKAFFGDANVYPGDEEAMSVDMLKQQLAKYNKGLEDAVDEIDIEFYKDKIDRLEELMLNAPVEAVPVDNYEYNIYRGYLEGDENEFMIDFGTYNEGIVSDGVNLQFSEIYIGYVYEKPYYGFEGYEDDIEWKNACSETEQYEIINKLITDAGIYNVNGEQFDASTAFCFGKNDKGISGIDITGTLKKMQRFRYAAYDSDHTVSAHFSGNKIRYGSVYNPIKINSIEKDINVLSFDEIKQIIVAALADGKLDLSEIGAGEVNNKYSLNSMYLAYWQVKEGNNIRIAPAWVFLDGLLVFDAVTGEQIR